MTTSTKSRDGKSGIGKRFEPTDTDSLHILPLECLPLQTKGLQKARLVINERLEPNVEMFSNPGTGSGQISARHLSAMFAFGDNNNDPIIVNAMAKLPAFDVYNLRIALRRMDIDVDEDKHLKLSEPMVLELSGYMRAFLRPMVEVLFSEEDTEQTTINSAVDTIRNADPRTVYQRICKLADTLKTTVDSIPAFIQDLGDIYLAIAFYRYCYDQIADKFDDLDDVINNLYVDRDVNKNRALMEACSVIQSKFIDLRSGLTNLFDLFDMGIKELWEGLSLDGFRKLQQTLAGYQATLGGALCALTVKIKAWSSSFSPQLDAGAYRYADFILGTMFPGVQSIKDIAYEDTL